MAWISAKEQYLSQGKSPSQRVVDQTHDLLNNLPNFFTLNNTLKRLKKQLDSYQDDIVEVAKILLQIYSILKDLELETKYLTKKDSLLKQIKILAFNFNLIENSVCVFKDSKDGLVLYINQKEYVVENAEPIGEEQLDEDDQKLDSAFDGITDGSLKFNSSKAQSSTPSNYLSVAIELVASLLSGIAEIIKQCISKKPKETQKKTEEKLEEKQIEGSDRETTLFLEKNNITNGNENHDISVTWHKRWLAFKASILAELKDSEVNELSDSKEMKEFVDDIMIRPSGHSDFFDQCLQSDERFDDLFFKHVIDNPIIPQSDETEELTDYQADVLTHGEKSADFIRSLNLDTEHPDISKKDQIIQCYKQWLTFSKDFLKRGKAEGLTAAISSVAVEFLRQILPEDKYIFDTYILTENNWLELFSDFAIRNINNGNYANLYFDEIEKKAGFINYIPSVNARDAFLRLCKTKLEQKTQKGAFKQQARSTTSFLAFCREQKKLHQRQAVISSVLKTLSQDVMYDNSNSGKDLHNRQLNSKSNEMRKNVARLTSFWTPSTLSRLHAKHDHAKKSEKTEPSPVILSKLGFHCGFYSDMYRHQREELAQDNSSSIMPASWQ